MKDYKNISQAVGFILLIIFNFVTVAYLTVIVYNVFCSNNLENYNLTFIIILITSIATGSFFLVRVYIENQLGIKEKEMLKEYQDALDKQTKEQNIKFDNMVTTEQLKQQFDNINIATKKQLEKQTEQLQPVIDWANQQIAKEKENNS